MQWFLRSTPDKTCDYLTLGRKSGKYHGRVREMSMHDQVIDGNSNGKQEPRLKKNLDDGLWDLGFVALVIGFTLGVEYDSRDVYVPTGIHLLTAWFGE